MTYFTLGPVEMDSETLKISSQPLPYFRDESFSEVNIEISYHLKKFLRTDASTELAMLTASGTAAMEAAVINFFNCDDKLLVINGGGFGQRFVDICSRHRIPHEVILVDDATVVDDSLLSTFDDLVITGILMNVHETSIGRYFPLEAISRFSRERGAILVVDAISSFMAEPYAMDEWGVDVTIFSSHKSLAVAPGLSFVAVNQASWLKSFGKATPPLYLDLFEHVKQGKRGQTPFTPAVGVMLQLHDKLMRIEKMGLQQFLSEIEERSKHFRNGVEQLPVVLPEYQLSNALTPVMLSGYDAVDIYQRLRDDYNIFVNPCGGRFRHAMLRVGHMGNLTLDDYDRLIRSLKELLV